MSDHVAQGFGIVILAYFILDGWVRGKRIEADVASIKHWLGVDEGSQP